jgi:hypothetical protein
MHDPWFVILRDFTVILAAAAVIVVSAFTAMVVWRLYKLALQVRAEMEPIMESMGRTAETVETSGAFMSGQKLRGPALTGGLPLERRMPSPVAAFGLAAGAFQLFNMARELQRGASGAAPGGAAQSLPGAGPVTAEGASQAAAPATPGAGAIASDTGAT